jgi:uncharacterized membrane protein
MLNFLRKNQEREKSHKYTLGISLGAGILGLIASFVLTIEKFHKYENPGEALGCDFNAIFNCSTVMQTWQSSLFGFPNMVIGLMAFSVVVTVAVALLAGSVLPKLFLKLANIGYLIGAVFAYWLFFQSLYVIEVLCPWCLVVTFSTTLLLASMTHYNLRLNTFDLSKKNNKKVQAFLDKGYHQLIVASWIVLLVVLVYVKFAFN